MDIGEVEKNADKAANLLKALSNDKRLLILCALYKEERCVGDLENLVDLSQSALSQHLARLRRDGLVKTRRDAQTIYYSLEDETVKAMLHTLYSIYKPCEEVTA
jgi:DNA-binding transcriptional ArsR family regulator